MTTTLNQDAWIEIFKKYDVVGQIEKNGVFYIDSDQIKIFREPRLMTKFDHSNQLPQIFQDHEISILPITRGSYVMGHFDVFHPLEKKTVTLKSFNFCNKLETLDFSKISSEPLAVSCVYVSKILEDFLDEEVVPTVSGRMGSGQFSFQINTTTQTNRTIVVDRAQIEIDAGFEGPKSFCLIEAKNHLPNDFVVRQLYYPLRKWKPLITKRIRSVFMTYSNGVFELREYGFNDLDSYNSIYLLQCKKYVISDSQVSIKSVLELVKSIKAESEPVGIPFPQANSFQRVINLCELLSNDGTLSKNEITEKYGFHSRQTDYYSNAAKYLGLIEESENGLVLTAATKQNFRQSVAGRRMYFIQQMIKRNVFREAVIIYLEHTKMPTSEQLITIVTNANLSNIDSESTIVRRTSTVKAWLNWVIEQIEL